MDASSYRPKDTAGLPKQGRTAFRAVSFAAAATVLALLAFLVIGVDSDEASTVPSIPAESVYTHNYIIDAPGSPNESSG